MDRDLRDSLQQLLTNAEKRTIQVQEATGLGCPSGCGVCCSNPRVETSPLDWILQAEHIIRDGDLESILLQLDSVETHSPCIYYISDPDYPGRGRCGSYENRPMICRLFGYSAVRDKKGNKKASICKVHKELMPHETSRFAILAENSDIVPIFSDLYTEFSGLKPNWIEQMPINQALRKALEILSLIPNEPGEDPSHSHSTDWEGADSSCLPEAI